MSELKPCPFCKCEMQVKTVGRDWYRIEGDHKETCFFELDDNRLMVPQSDDQLAAGRYDAIGDVIEILERYR